MVTTPPVVTLRIALFAVSPTYRKFPTASIPVGVLNLAAVPVPSTKPDVAVRDPANISVAPVLVFTVLILCADAPSSTYRVVPITATPLMFVNLAVEPVPSTFPAAVTDPASVVTLPAEVYFLIALPLSTRYRDPEESPAIHVRLVNLAAVPVPSVVPLAVRDPAVTIPEGVVLRDVPSETYGTDPFGQTISNGVPYLKY